MRKAILVFNLKSSSARLDFLIITALCEKRNSDFQNLKPTTNRCFFV